jgi:tight adherence protein B
VNPLFYIVVFVGTVFTLEGLYYLFLERRADQAAVKRRLQRLAAKIRVPRDHDDESILLGEDRQSGTLDSLLASLPQTERLRLQLYRAGLTMSVRRFVLLTLGLGLGAWLLASTFLADPVRAFPFAALAGALPWIQMQRLAHKRMRAFEEQLPAALELVTRALRAGNSLTFALQMVGEELSDPVGTEFTHVVHQVKLGKNVDTALDELAYRITVGDLPFFVTAVSIQRTTGGNLAEILDKLSQLIRERFKLYGKIRSLTAVGRASANLLAVWPLFMVGALYTVAPDYVAPLWEHETGFTLVLVSIALVVFGYVLCRRFATIQV